MDPAVQALCIELVSNGEWIMHSRQGHFPHSDKCAHCIAARLKQRARRRKGKKDGSRLTNDGTRIGPIPKYGFNGANALRT